ncbi:MAG TPA: ABC transporter ATP-binding protein [Thermoanaerobaculia bacterium]|nr:ABC transporter ATP-binding protein [Thermoanaerobaculia bacterium]
MLQLAGVSFSYRGAAEGTGSPRALHDVTFSAGGRTLIALTGENGSGKSTLLKVMARVAAPQQGEVRFEGRSLREWGAKEYARNAGYLPQEPDSSFPMRAVDIVVSGRAPFLTRFGWEGEADYAAAEEALAMCDAAHLAGRYLDEMSGGERKRVFLARVLAARPKLILLDEPLSALDVAHVQRFSRLLRQIVDQTGATVIFASHDLNWAAAYSDRVVVMRGGRIAADVPPQEIMRPELVRDLFGLEAHAVTTGERTWIVPAL